MKGWIGRFRDMPVSLYFIAILLAGLIAIWVYTYQQPNAYLAFSIALGISMVAGLIGVLIGVLFGIPRAQKVEGVVSPGGGESDYRPNTNLEEISDWLTKIIVGVGLVEATTIWGGLENFATHAGQAVARAGATANAASVDSEPQIFALSIALSFAITGFLGGYIWSRTELAAKFSIAEQLVRSTPEYYEALMHGYLYRPAPGGFMEALRTAETFERKWPNGGSDRFWLYKACALGQKHGFEIAGGLTKASEKTEGEALVCVNKAVYANPDLRELLHSLMHPERNSKENDLASFKGKTLFEDALRIETEQP